MMSLPPLLNLALLLYMFVVLTAVTLWFALTLRRGKRKQSERGDAVSQAKNAAKRESKRSRASNSKSNSPRATQTAATFYKATAPQTCAPQTRAY